MSRWMLHWLAKSCCHLTSPGSNPPLLQTWASALGLLFSVSLIRSDVSVVFDPGPVFMLKAFMADLAEALKHGWNVSLPHSSSRRDVLLRECVWVCVHTQAIAQSGSQGPAPPRCSLRYSVQMREGACVRTVWKTHFQRRKSGLETGTPPTHPSEQLTSPFKGKNAKQTSHSELLCRNFENSAVGWILSESFPSCLTQNNHKSLNLKSEKRLTCQNTQMSGAQNKAVGYCKLRLGI